MRETLLVQEVTFIYPCSFSSGGIVSVSVLRHISCELQRRDNHRYFFDPFFAPEKIQVWKKN